MSNPLILRKLTDEEIEAIRVSFDDVWSTYKDKKPFILSEPIDIEIISPSIDHEVYNDYRWMIGANDQPS